MSVLLRVSVSNDLSRADLSQVKSWLDAVLSGEISEPPDFNWLGLAEILTTDVTSRPPAEALQWAYLAVRVYDHLLNAPDVLNRESKLISQMNVRAYMIRQLGSVPGDPVLDVDILMRWFFDELTISFDEVAPQVDDWPKRDITWIRTLRQIKNRLSRLRTLYESGRLPESAELSKWFSIWDRLP